jgi:spoIIIJ-associated protein
MTNERATIEKIAPTIDEAVEIALKELGLAEEDVEIEVLDEGAKGILGIGNRDARVRLTVKSESAEPIIEEDADAETSVEEKELTDLELNVVQITEATVTELLEKMDVYATVKSGLRDDEGPIPSVVVDINGNDLSILIGRKAETLNALEYITRLIVGKEVGHSVHINIDVEGYRKRREISLAQLAEKMADQAIKTGKPQSLEPMPANERRLVHIALRDNDLVETSSTGEDPRRKVKIIPIE